ncbi:ketoacyl-ACP synthase III family protein [Nocardia sp. NPDC004278]|uniref:ketoacyl-ACP synthase III family protein n=1 Tax=Nocardia lijiangensis TaxID=299618 RepID=UPI000836329D|nr:ketoacyl-ACP synthase III family protein [Nocardia lijiangensis]
MIPENIFVKGIGTYRPEVVGVDTAIAQGLYSAEQAEQTGLLGATVSTDLSAPEMALMASGQALERASTSAEQVDMLLYADAFRAGPEGWLPHAYLQKRLVGGRAFAAGIRQGCNGVLGALELAAGYLQGSADHAVALIAAGDNFTSADVDRWQCGRPHMLLADGGAAVVLAKEGFARLAAIGSLALPEFEEMHRGTQPLLPASRQLDFTDRLIEFEGTENAEGFWMGYLTAAPKLMEQLLQDAGIAAGDLTRVFMQHASRDFVENGLLNLIEVPLDRSTWDFGRRIGHAGPSDYLMSFDHVLTTGEVGPGDYVLAFGVAPGFSLAGAIFHIVDRPGWVA